MAITDGALNLNERNLHRFTANVLAYLGASVAPEEVSEATAPAIPTGDAMHFTFDGSGTGTAEDVASGMDAAIVSYLREPEFRDGLEGRAMDFDGYSTFLDLGEGRLPLNPDAFTVEARIALRAYPGNSAPIINQHDQNAGFTFEITSYGRLLGRVHAGSGWVTAVSSERLPLDEWLHVAATFGRDDGLDLFVNGERVARAHLVVGAEVGLIAVR